MIQVAILATLILLPLAYVVVKDLRRTKQLKYMAAAERACAEFGAIRNELAIARASGRISDEDLEAFVYLTRSCTNVLRIPKFFREMSTAVCVAIANDRIPEPNRLRVGPSLQPQFVRFVDALDKLIHQFAHPFIVAAATMNGCSSIDLMFRMRDWSREIRRQRRALESIRQGTKSILAAA